MGFKHGQNYFSETYRPSSVNNDRPEPPPLPPRATSNPEEPPPYTGLAPIYHSQPLTHSWSNQDPRSTSTQSLVSEQQLEDGKRTLLLIYIHGFMGNETSFQSFPAHVHNLVTVKLGDTHQIHSKIYPRYKSRKAIDYAREDFSNWLRPHESSNTDVILIGHSMGGILSAEVALLGLVPNSGRKNASHRILGTISLDTPFLGMHPGIIVSGIGSLFRSTPTAPGAATEPTGSKDPSEISIPMPTSADVTFDSPSPTCPQSENEQAIPPFLSPINDPNYNAPFPNDVRVATRSGWANALHFINKHSDDLTKATKSSLASYFEFGGCMADYNGLKTRYSRLRALEDVESHQAHTRRRTRFVNYYTASTGRLKHNPQRSKSGRSDGGGLHPNEPASDIPGNRTVAMEVIKMSINNEGTLSHASSLQGSREEQLDNEVVGNTHKETDDPALTNTTLFGGNIVPVSEDASRQDVNECEPQPVDVARSLFEDDTEPDCAREQEHSDTEPRKQSEGRDFFTTSLSETSGLPPIPPQPEQPALFDPIPYSDKDTRKLAKKAHSRQLKAFQRAVKDRDQAIIDRRRLVEKREKKAKLDHEKQLKKEGKEIAKLTRGNGKKTPRPAQGSKKGPESGDATDNENSNAPKPKRDRKFCMLPPKINGKIDTCWVRVYMRDVDEVGAHCGLFFLGAHYEWLINDVGERIKAWVERNEGQGEPLSDLTV